MVRCYFAPARKKSRERVYLALLFGLDFALIIAPFQKILQPIVA